MVAAGDAHTCAIASGGVLCWGAGDEGQLGDATFTGHAQPMPVMSEVGVVSLATGGGHTCAVTSAGAVACWGRDDFGQLGDGGTANQGAPTPVIPSASQPVQMSTIAAGTSHTCALTVDGQTFCWGRGDSGQLGSPPVTSGPPTAVAGPPGSQAIATGGAHTCALSLTGHVWCWGANDVGQLGNGQESPNGAPVEVPGLDGVVEISAGASHTCALRGDRSVWCWGGNQSGQLGDGVVLQMSTPQLDRLACR